MNTERGSVVIVNPNSGGNYVQSKVHREHLGLGYLTSELRQAGFEANAASISLLTLMSAILFKDELSVKKMIGIAGVTLGLFALFI